MAVIGLRVAVANVPTLVVAADPDGSSVLVRNADAAAAVDLGGPTVATGAGFSLGAGAAVSLDLAPNEKLYGVTASGSITVHVLENRV